MPPFMKYLVVFVLIVIIYNLFKAFYHLSNQKSNPKQVVKALVVRVGFSLALFLSLLLASYFGAIKPHGLLPVEQPNSQQPIIENKKGATQ